MKHAGTAGDPAVESGVDAAAPPGAQGAGVLARARIFAEPLIGGEALDSGENTMEHARGVAGILRAIGGSELMQAASYLVYT